MRFDLKKFFRFFSLLKILFPLLVFQFGASLKCAEGQVYQVTRFPYIKFQLTSGLLTSSSEGADVSLSFINNQTARIGQLLYDHPIHNIKFTITPVTVSGDEKHFLEMEKNNRVVGGLTFLGGQNCKGADPFSVLCSHPGVIANGGGTVSFRAKVDFDQYSTNEYVNRTGTVLLRVLMTYNISDAFGTPGGTMVFVTVPVSLVKPVVPTPTPTATATPTKAPPIVPTATPTPIVVVPPTAPPAFPPLTPNPNSGPICGKVMPQRSCDCLKCDDENIFDIKADLFSKFSKATEVARNAVATLAKYDIKRLPLPVRKAERIIANSLEDLKEVLDSFGDTNLECESRKYCQDVSNKYLLADLGDIDARILDISDAVRRALPNRLASSAKDKKSIRRASVDASYEVKDQLEEFPTTTSVCSETDAAIVCGGDA